MLTSWQLMILIGSQVLLSLATLSALLVSLKRKQSKMRCNIAYRIHSSQKQQTVIEFEGINLKYIPVYLESCGFLLPRPWSDRLRGKPQRTLVLTELNQQLEEKQRMLRSDEKVTLTVAEEILQQQLTQLGLSGHLKLYFYFKDHMGKRYPIPFKLDVPQLETNTSEKN